MPRLRAYVDYAANFGLCIEIAVGTELLELREHLAFNSEALIV